MGAPVILTTQAQEDLREIVAFIARRNEARGRSFGDELTKKAADLGAHPQMGRVVPKQSDPGVREVIHGSYRIVYEVLDNPSRIFVLRFWHGARGTPQIVED